MSGCARQRCLGIDLHWRGRLKGWMTRAEFEGQDSECPPVHLTPPQNAETAHSAHSRTAALRCSSESRSAKVWPALCFNSADVHFKSCRGLWMR